MMEIDRLFPLPRNVVDVRNSDEFFEGYEEAVDETIDDTPGSQPSVPTDFEIISQQVRRLPGGTSVVDVTVRFPNEDGQQEYEVRITQL